MVVANIMQFFVLALDFLGSSYGGNIWGITSIMSFLFLLAYDAAPRVLFTCKQAMDRIIGVNPSTSLKDSGGLMLIWVIIKTFVLVVIQLLVAFLLPMIIPVLIVLGILYLIRLGINYIVDHLRNRKENYEEYEEYESFESGSDNDDNDDEISSVKELK